MTLSIDAIGHVASKYLAQQLFPFLI